MKIQRFEQLLSWQKTRILNLSIYTITNKELFAKDFSLKIRSGDLQFRLLQTFQRALKGMEPKNSFNSYQLRKLQPEN